MTDVCNCMFIFFQSKRWRNIERVHRHRYRARRRIQTFKEEEILYASRWASPRRLQKEAKRRMRSVEIANPNLVLNVPRTSWPYKHPQVPLPTRYLHCISSIHPSNHQGIILKLHPQEQSQCLKYDYHDSGSSPSHLQILHQRRNKAQAQENP